MSAKYEDAIARIIDWIEKFETTDAESKEIVVYLTLMLCHLMEGHSESAFKYFSYLGEVIE